MSIRKSELNPKTCLSETDVGSFIQIDSYHPELRLAKGHAFLGSFAGK